jgi:outer membrane receptor protein involved in Fe transport
MSEWFSLGNTLITGSNYVGDQTMTGQYLELRDAFRLYAGKHELKFGGSVQWIEEDWYYPVLPNGQLYWVTDARVLPYIYNFAVGEPQLLIDTTLYGLFVQDDWRVTPNFTLSLGLRYDYDTDGNNPDFTHPLSPEQRSVDSDNYQPRVSFLWDIGGSGSSVLRGGGGIFTGRYLLVPGFVEQQQNGVTGRTIYTRLNGALLGLPPAFWIDPNDPANTGILLAPNIALMESSLEAPEATQASLGFTQKLGDTGLYVDLDGIWVEGDNEIILRDVNFSGNEAIAGGAPVRPNSSYTQINVYTNEGRSEYRALVASLNGTLKGGHLITASFTWADKKNISDDFSPNATDYASDPADIEGEWGRSRADERYRIILSGIFRLPWQITLAPIYEYGSGQPWNPRLGYDYNGDLRATDREAGVEKYSEDGPDYNNNQATPAAST